MSCNCAVRPTNNYQDSKIAFFKKRILLSSLNSNIVRLFGCFIVDAAKAKLIDCIRKPLELFIMTFQHLINYLIRTDREAATRGVLCQKVFLEISQNSQENTCARVFFNTVAGLRPVTLFKKEALAQVFSCEFCELSKNSFCDKTTLVAASVLTCKANSSNLSISKIFSLFIHLMLIFFI